MEKSVCAAALFALAATAASAQTVDPRYLQFTASADHFALTTDGQPLVTGYQMAWYQSGASSPFQILDLGKPIPDSNGAIVVDLNTLLTSAPAAGIIYDARVAAVGPTGSAESSDSNAFVYSGPCTYAVSPTNVTGAAAGGVGALGIATGASCVWSTTSQAAWLTLGAANGSGSASVALTIAPNNTASPRSGTISAADATVSVAQDAAPCNFAVSPLNVAMAAAGGNASASVTTTASGCGWNASNSTAWIALATTAGTDAQTVAYTVTANPTTTARTGTFTIAGQTITVSQDPTAPVCTYALSANAASFTLAGGTGSVTLTTGSTCAWTATDSAGWISVNPVSGTGSKTIIYTVAKNNGAQTRTATLTIGGQTLTVTEAGKK
jgi:hypothetical protein